MANNCMKRCSMSLVSEKWKSSHNEISSWRYPVRMTIIQKTRIKSWRGCGKRELSYIFGGNINWNYPPMENCVRRFPKILKIELSSALATHVWVFIQRKMKNCSLKVIFIPFAHCSVICNSQDTAAAWTSTDRWVAKEDAVCISPHDYHSAIKRTTFFHLQ